MKRATELCGTEHAFGNCNDSPHPHSERGSASHTRPRSWAWAACGGRPSGRRHPPLAAEPRGEKARARLPLLPRRRGPLPCIARSSTTRRS